MTTWSGQTLTFNYNFPTLGQVFTGSPIIFVADGSSHLSTFANINPATFAVSTIAPNEVQISYTYPIASYPQGFTLNGTVAFNGFIISGPSNLQPIISAFVDPGSTVSGLTNASVAFTGTAVTVNLAGDVFAAGSVGLIDVQFAVPEPGSLLVLAPGLIIAIALARSSRFGISKALPRSINQRR